ncbi:YfjI family protein [Candidatus Thiothrix sp. Deng01]|uniref:YfjI family protein n=1 Tax=Candidatus Thiothrix phosphatis TaxID=3112415 RepID=A0ABU6CRQ1_9GAMM|nr:YfjI family protein [Candidatus Thiothrix sp. Deng01]MEB4589513.1 YfjI family protein [Candidatus Thiothrix sp. Deng01]
MNTPTTHNIPTGKPALSVVNGFVRTEKPTADGWEQPESLLMGGQGAKYPLSALPGIIGGAIREVVADVKCPPALAASSALSVLAIAGQGVANVQANSRIKPSPLSLYTLSIGESGERKTTADSFFSDVLETWALNKQQEREQDVIRSRAVITSWEKELEGIKEAIKQAGRKQEDTGELTEQLIRLEQSKPAGIHSPKMKYTDTTTESLAHKLVHLWPSAGVLSSEAGIVFGGYGMKADNITRSLAFYNTAWEGGRTSIDRRGDGGSFEVRDVRLSMGLAVQPNVIHDFYDNNGELARGSGFAARFLLAWPESTQGKRQLTLEELTSAPGKNGLSLFYAKLHEVLERQYVNGQGGKLESLPTLKFSRAALEIWLDYFNSIEDELNAGGRFEQHKDIASKSADNAARLAGLFHLFNGGDIHDAIQPDAMGAAANLAGWHLYEAKRFFDEIAVPVDISNALKLDGWLTRYCKDRHTDGIGKREARQLAPNRLRSIQELDRALDTLVEHNRVRIIAEGRKERIEVNPQLLAG